MNEIEKFRADVRRIIKYERADNIKVYDGIQVAKKIGQLFCKLNPSLGNLPASIVDYWLESMEQDTTVVAEQPSEKNIDWLVAALSFLEGMASECQCFTQSDWKKMSELINYEAEDLPLDHLSSLMSILVEKRAI
ncbi:MAG: hypothetical protein J6B81_03945 [Spirochaetaceae bacterium]|nr:hypothetical protein [Spirochaetaceae bacterium]